MNLTKSPGEIFLIFHRGFNIHFNGGITSEIDINLFGGREGGGGEGLNKRKIEV